jgi:hypothetical protein
MKGVMAVCSALLAGAVLVGMIGDVGMAGEPGEEPLGFFSGSLHYTTEGMRYWYEEHSGLMDITGIPYEKLDCQNCHVNSCDVCHAVQDGEVFRYNSAMPEDKDVCLVCHTRAKTAFKIGEQKVELDVHIGAGMGCADCHIGADVHGDGVFYHTMRDPEAVKASCQDCHTFEGELSRAHSVHKGKLDCAACHVSNSLTCMNCHFGKFVETGQRAGNFVPPIQDWMLLINYEGQVTSGTVQTLVYDGKKFIAYAPYFTHAIQRGGKACVDCHANPAVQMVKNGETVKMGEWKDGQMTMWQGVVPCVPEQLQWPFLDKQDGEWVVIGDEEDVQVQMVGYGTALTEEQMKKLAMPLKK